VLLFGGPEVAQVLDPKNGSLPADIAWFGAWSSLAYAAALFLSVQAAFHRACPGCGAIDLDPVNFDPSFPDGAAGDEWRCRGCGARGSTDPNDASPLVQGAARPFWGSRLRGWALHGAFGLAGLSLLGWAISAGVSVILPLAMPLLLAAVFLTLTTPEESVRNRLGYACAIIGAGVGFILWSVLAL
jgi:hypothetical protein